MASTTCSIPSFNTSTTCVGWDLSSEQESYTRMASRPFLISLVFNSWSFSSLSPRDKPKGSNHLPPGYLQVFLAQPLISITPPSSAKVHVPKNMRKTGTKVGWSVPVPVAFSEWGVLPNLLHVITAQKNARIGESPLMMLADIQTGTPAGLHML